MSTGQFELDVDASFDKSLWFSNKGRNDSRVSDLAAVLAVEDHDRFAAEAKGRGRGEQEGAREETREGGCQVLTRREVERVLHSGVDVDSHLVKGPCIWNVYENAKFLKHVGQACPAKDDSRRQQT